MTTRNHRSNHLQTVPAWQQVANENDSPNRLKDRMWPYLVGLGAITLALVAHNSTIIEKPDFSEVSQVKIVTPGDTLWDIANDVTGADKVDTRLIMDEIKSNSPDTADGFDVGDKLNVPKSVNQ